METVTRLQNLRIAVDKLREGGRIALVPTMGALHDGHLSLVRAARERADHVVASIFVNPAQFGPNEDLDAYPRQLAEDSRMLEGEGVALLWAPPVEEVYPEGFATSISVSGVSENYCGAARPGHFDGVATVVCKLFNQVAPDIALFGEKDYQQLAVIRRMARDLDLFRPCADDIIGIPTMREEDGLAMSSRNRYLSPEHRRQAGGLPVAMRAAVTDLESGMALEEVLNALRTTLLRVGFESVDYAAFADAESLERLVAPPSTPARLLVAARVGGTRLIDSLAVKSLS
ncbi:pantoate--beta-alanine ligase [Altererythrobacter sp. SALINAS58]|uniref:pantoate--beta-alanine ligase n=1 Tax=Alteripontixanthobacter muriae TaxID=2705546 RepID=UPI0015756DDE|nr:pantoate--beta-alanine ligase [Alteripontixanthobacter muriae]